MKLKINEKKRKGSENKTEEIKEVKDELNKE